MKDKYIEPPSPWARRLHARLKRVLGWQIRSLEARTKARVKPKSRRGKKRKATHRT